MARKPRLHVPGGLYHVFLRGNARQMTHKKGSGLANCTLVPSLALKTQAEESPAQIPAPQPADRECDL